MLTSTLPVDKVCKLYAQEKRSKNFQTHLRRGIRWVGEEKKTIDLIKSHKSKETGTGYDLQENPDAEGNLHEQTEKMKQNSSWLTLKSKDALSKPQSIQEQMKITYTGKQYNSFSYPRGRRKNCINYIDQKERKLPTTKEQ